MPENPVVDKFLQESIIKQRPLSEGERKKALVVAREVWKKGIEIAKGGHYAGLAYDAPDGRSAYLMDLFLGKPTHRRYISSSSSNVDLIIVGMERSLDEYEGLPVWIDSDIEEIYSFSPDKITKEVLDQSAVPFLEREEIRSARRDFIAKMLKKDPLMHAASIERSMKQLDEQKVTYEPNVDQLNDLLFKLTSAKTLMILEQWGKPTL